MTDASVFALSMLAIVIIFAGPCGDDPPPAQTDAVTAPAELVLPEEQKSVIPLSSKKAISAKIRRSSLCLPFFCA